MIISLCGPAHNVGDQKCSECWSEEWPRPCPCGGLIHAEFGDETDEGYWLEYKCDRCGSTEDPTTGGAR